MKVILLEDVKSLGKRGELVEASDGYARNYLLPRKLAKEANAQAMNEYKNAENSKNYKIATQKAQAEAAKKQLEGKVFRMTARAGQGGKLFGSIGHNGLNFFIRIHNKGLFFQNNFFVELANPAFNHFFNNVGRLAGSGSLFGKNALFMFNGFTRNTGNIQRNRSGCGNMHGNVLT